MAFCSSQIIRLIAKVILWLRKPQYVKEQFWAIDDITRNNRPSVAAQCPPYAY
jgi:hypothetical protein